MRYDKHLMHSMFLKNGCLYCIHRETYTYTHHVFSPSIWSKITAPSRPQLNTNDTLRQHAVMRYTLVKLGLARKLSYKGVILYLHNPSS